MSQQDQRPAGVLGDDSLVRGGEALEQGHDSLTGGGRTGEAGSRVAQRYAGVAHQPAPLRAPNRAAVEHLAEFILAERGQPFKRWREEGLSSEGFLPAGPESSIAALGMTGARGRICANT